MNKDKPSLYDPEEWKIIRQMYFNPHDFNKYDKLDTLEQLDRQESKQRNNQKSSR